MRHAKAGRVLLSVLGAAGLALPGQAQSVTLESVNASGLWGAISDLSAPNVNLVGLSADARFVAFTTQASNIVPGDHAWGNLDVFVRDRDTGAVDCVSVRPDGVPGFGDSWLGDLSADGRYVVFHSDAPDLVAGDTNGVDDVFLRDRLLGVTERVSVSTTGAQGNAYSSIPAVSDDGRFVAFSSLATNFVAGDVPFTGDVFLRDRLLGTTTLVTVNTSGLPGNGSGGNVSLSSDGNLVVFQTSASDLVPGDVNGRVDVFARDMAAGATELVSVRSDGAQGDADSWIGRTSADGRLVAFHSAATNLVPGDTNAASDVFLRDRLLGTTTRVSVSTSGVQGDLGSAWAAFSDDGRWLAFESQATTLDPPDANGAIRDVYARDLLAGTTARVSRTWTGAAADGDCWQAQVSADGRFVALISEATNLTPLDNILDDAYLVDRQLVCPPMERYCTAKTNSQGCAPTMGTAGAPLTSGPDSFFLVAYGVLPGENGILFWGLAPAATPFGGGTLCVAPPVTRTPVQAAGTLLNPWSCDGTYSLQFRQAYMADHGLAGGDTLYAQWWGRDTGLPPPANVALTDAVRFTLCN